MIHRMSWNRTKLMYRKDDNQEWGGMNSCALLMATFLKVGRERKVDMDEVKLDVTDNLYANDTVMLREKMDDFASKCGVSFRQKQQRDKLLS